METNITVQLKKNKEILLYIFGNMHRDIFLNIFCSCFGIITNRGTRLFILSVQFPYFRYIERSVFFVYSNSYRNCHSSYCQTYDDCSQNQRLRQRVDHIKYSLLRRKYRGAALHAITYQSKKEMDGVFRNHYADDNLNKISLS